MKTRPRRAMTYIAALCTMAGCFAVGDTEEIDRTSAPVIADEPGRSGLFCCDASVQDLDGENVSWAALDELARQGVCVPDCLVSNDELSARDTALHWARGPRQHAQAGHAALVGDLIGRNDVNSCIDGTPIPPFSPRDTAKWLFGVGVNKMAGTAGVQLLKYLGGAVDVVTNVNHAKALVSAGGYLTVTTVKRATAWQEDCGQCVSACVASDQACTLSCDRQHAACLRTNTQVRRVNKHFGPGIAPAPLEDCQTEYDTCLCGCADLKHNCIQPLKDDTSFWLLHNPDDKGGCEADLDAPTCDPNDPNDPHRPHATNPLDIDGDDDVDLDDAKGALQSQIRPIAEVVGSLSMLPALSAAGSFARFDLHPSGDLDLMDLQNAALNGAGTQELCTMLQLWVPGDANCDLQVDFDDFLILSAHNEQVVTPFTNGDFDGSGFVDFDDFVILSASF